MSRVGLFGQISEINDHLFLSGAGVLKPDKIKQKKITFIVNATTEEPATYLSGVECLKIRIDDSPYSHLDTYFDLVADRIKANKDRGGRTLVHCVAGVSRSATLCLVYLVKYQRLNLRQAYFHVKCARPIIRPNIGFWKQMIEFEERLLGCASVRLVPSVHHENELIPDVYVNEIRRELITSQTLSGAARSVGGYSSTSPSSLLSRRSSPSSASTPSSRSSTNSRLYPPSTGSASTFTYSSPNSYRYQYGGGGVGTTNYNHSRSSLLSGRRSTSPAVTRLSYRNGGSSLIMPSSKLLTNGGSARRPKSTSTANGTLLSTIYQSSQELFFPTF